MSVSGLSRLGATFVFGPGHCCIRVRDIRRLDCEIWASVPWIRNVASNVERTRMSKCPEVCLWILGTKVQMSKHPNEILLHGFMVNQHRKMIVRMFQPHPSPVRYSFFGAKCQELAKRVIGQGQSITPCQNAEIRRSARRPDI